MILRSYLPPDKLLELTCKTQSFRLTVSVQKTKFMVVGYGVEEEDTLHMALDDSSTEHV